MGDKVGEEFVCGKLNERGCVWEIELERSLFVVSLMREGVYGRYSWRGDCLW